MSQSEQYMLTTRKSVIQWYRDQLAKFHRLGIGKFTEHNTKVSQTLIDTTEKRIIQLGGVDALHPDWGIIKIEPSNDNSTKRVKLFRKRQQVKAKLREMMDDNHTNGTASTTRSKSNGNTGHEEDQS